jgi:hypothetical protein
MNYSDRWIIVLISIILAACYHGGHEDIPDKAYPDNIPSVTPSPVPQLTNELLEPTTIQLKESACELENESLRVEADLWKQRYIDYQCNCQDDSYEATYD